MMNINDVRPPSPNLPDPRIEAMKEYLQMFSSHFREAVNSEVDMLMESVANYLKHSTAPNELQISNHSSVVKQVEIESKDEEKEHLIDELKKAQALMCVYKSSLQLSDAIIEKYLAEYLEPQE